MKTLYLFFALGVMATLVQPVTFTNCPETNKPPVRGECRR